MKEKLEQPKILGNGLQKYINDEMLYEKVMNNSNFFIRI